MNNILKNVTFCVNAKLFQQKSENIVFTLSRFCHQEVVRNHSLSEDIKEVGQADQEERVLKIAVVGLPNVGKSTLVNQLCKRRIFAMSKKVHTTKCRARGVYIEDKTQLVFLDTPGLVTHDEEKKYNLEKEFFEGGKKAAREADTILVIHDASNSYTRYQMDPKILHILHAFPEKNSILVLNKADAVKQKRYLLDVARIVSNDSLKKITDEVKETVKYKPYTADSINKRISQDKGYSNFSDIFMVSALEGVGIDDLRSHLMSISKPSKWIFSEDIFTDQDPVVMIQDAVRSRLLNELPQEVPYKASVQVEYLDFDRPNEVICSALIQCPSPRIERVIKGPQGDRIRRIAKETEEELQMTFKVPLRLKLVLTSKTPKSFG